MRPRGWPRLRRVTCTHRSRPDSALPRGSRAVEGASAAPGVGAALCLEGRGGRWGVCGAGSRCSALPRGWPTCRRRGRCSTSSTALTTCSTATTTTSSCGRGTPSGWSTSATPRTRRARSSARAATSRSSTPGRWPRASRAPGGGWTRLNSRRLHDPRGPPQHQRRSQPMEVRERIPLPALRGPGAAIM
jgi:hypothetical protein